MTSPILAEYDDLRSSYDAFRTHLASLLPQLLFADNIQPHKIESRLKSRQSLEKKLDELKNLIRSSRTSPISVAYV